MKLYYSGLSHVGMVRSNNEDHFFCGEIRPDEYLFVVADGMGGHRSGDIASKKAVKKLVDTLKDSPGQSSADFLKKLFTDVNLDICDENARSERKGNMGTTLTMLYIIKNRGCIVHVGDSRVYRYLPTTKRRKKPRLAQLTEDHSFVGKLLKNRLIKKEEAWNHPRRNIIYQSIGMRKEIEAQIIADFPIKKGEKYLLCSDGLHDVVREPDLKNKLITLSPELCAQKLIDQANANGGPDNISVIVVSTITSA